ncbi:unnamed protein product [Rotaria sordida]|uniref:F-box domain-containing protein n=2 Tax=Rotaria sordida TaxID=392033 RepID=A0A819MNB5_9BILA|nr:unnamed protein product [Rotaria sordida]
MICQQHLPFITDRVYVLSLSDDDNTPEQINLFLSYVSSFSQFTWLRSLSFSNICSNETLIKIINECQYLYNLTHLTFGCHSLRRYQVNFQLLIDTIWNLPKLRYCHLDFPTQGQEKFFISTKMSSTLEYVNMLEYVLTWNEMNRLFQCTPRLKQLSILVYIHSSNDNDYVLFASLPILIDLHIDIWSTFDVSKMISFLKNIPNLRRLNVTLWYNIINGYQWEEIIRNYLPKLKIFRVEMRKKLFLDENMQERIDQLINSFRSSFWIEEHQWFVRCLTVKKTIYFYNLPSSFCICENKLPDLWRSTYPDDNQQEFYNNITTIHNEIFFNQLILPEFRLRNINDLHIRLPINDQFWSIVPSLERLSSLNISYHTDHFQSQLQALLDRAPHLRYLCIDQDQSLPLQISLFKYTNKSVRELNLQNYNYSFDEEECMRLCHSPLGIQCQILFIHVKNRQSIIILVKNMINLQVLHIKCNDEMFNKQSTSNENNNEQFYDENIENKDDLIQWLKDHLPSTCLVVKDLHSTSLIRIWI